MRTVVAILVVAFLEGAAGAAELPEPQTLDEEIATARELTDDAPEAVLAIEGTAGLAEADAEADSIAVRLRRARSVRRSSALWPRIALWLSVAQGAPGRVDREAGEPDALGWTGRRGLTWAVVATWGAP